MAKNQHKKDLINLAEAYGTDDKELLDKVKGMGTAGDRLIEAAEERLKKDPKRGLTDAERDALARDAYGDAEKHIAHDKAEDYESTSEF